MVNIAGYAVFFDQLGGPPAAVRAIEQRSGGYLDPAIAATFTARAEPLLAPAAAGDPSDQLLAAEPSPPTLVMAGDLDEVLRIFGEAVDLKTPFLHGHCTGVSRLADGAGRRLGLSDDEVTLARAARPVRDGARPGRPQQSRSAV